MAFYFQIMMKVLFSLQKVVIETVKKLNWSPDVIHVHGWLAAILPIYLKQYYKDEALFADTKIVTSYITSLLKVHLI